MEHDSQVRMQMAYENQVSSHEAESVPLYWVVILCMPSDPGQFYCCSFADAFSPALALVEQHHAPPPYPVWGGSPVRKLWGSLLLLSCSVLDYKTLGNDQHGHGPR